MCMKALLQSKGVDINVLTTNKETPLHKAAMAGRESNIRKLLETGADVFLKEKTNHNHNHNHNLNPNSNPIWMSF